MQPIKKLKIDLNRHILELLDGPKNARNGPEPVKQLIYLIYLHKRSKNLHLNFSTKTQPINKLKIDPNRYILRLLDESKNASSDPQFLKQLIYLMYPSCTRHQKPTIELLHKDTTY